MLLPNTNNIRLTRCMFYWNDLPSTLRLCQELKTANNSDPRLTSSQPILPAWVIDMTEEEDNSRDSPSPSATNN